jgi:hypothetical protein
MLTDIYIEALLVDEDLADQVFEAFEAGEIDDCAAYFAWLLISFSSLGKFIEIERQELLRARDCPSSIITTLSSG